MKRLVLDAATRREVEGHIRAAAPREGGAYIMVRAAATDRGVRLVGSQPFLPPDDHWEYQGEDMLRPTAKGLSAAISRAYDAKSGLLFVHSHPRKDHPSGFSGVDMQALESLAPTIAPMLDGPFAAAVVHEGRWAAVVWQDGTWREVNYVQAVARTLDFLSPIPPAPAEDADLDTRQRAALGRVHDVVRALTVAVVGCGGLGSPIAEQLVRMGVRRLLLVDDDVLDTPSNARRVFGTSKADALTVPPRKKAEVVAAYLRSLDLGTEVVPLPKDTRRESVARALLDADVICCGTDNHASRSILNDLATAYFLPMIDSGVRPATNEHALQGLLAEVRVVVPGGPCLWCMRAISQRVIWQENLPAEELEALRREDYVQGMTGLPVPSVVAVTVLGSGMATCALLGILGGSPEQLVPAYWMDGLLGDGRPLPVPTVDPACRCRGLFGLADQAQIPFMS